MSREPSRSTLVVAHRGDHRQHTENTIPAIESAIAEGADMVELDIHLDADGEVVVVHDATFLRLWGDPRPVAAMTSDAVRSLGEGVRRVPLLADVLRLAYATGVPLVLDQKTPEAAVAALRIVERLGMQQTTLFCGQLPGLRAVREVSPAARLFLNTDGLTPPDVRVLGTLRPEMVNVEHSAIAPILVDSLHNLGFGVSCWTPNGRGDLERLLAMGVDAVMTDDVPQARALVDQPVRASVPGATGIEQLASIPRSASPERRPSARWGLVDSGAPTWWD